MTGAEPACRASRRQQHRETRRDRDAFLAAAQLIPIVQRRIAQPRARWALRALHRDRITELMRLRADGPFLRARVRPRRAAQRSLPGADVLHDARLLIVRFFNKEAVVGDGLSDGRTAERPDGQQHNDSETKVSQSAAERTSRSSLDNS